mmetsp:Transcript_5042/g.12774  ORF Transcript_5042/g.12774 Transcript_5042/m.12774 type:complete len:120 (-) Transcript_5042:851-1210(-)
MTRSKDGRHVRQTVKKTVLSFESNPPFLCSSTTMALGERERLEKGTKSIEHNEVDIYSNIVVAESADTLIDMSKSSDFSSILKARLIIHRPILNRTTGPNRTKTTHRNNLPKQLRLRHR